MLIIRHAQLAAFGRAASQSFEDDIVGRLQRFAPHHAAGIGEDAVRLVVRDGITRAASYGFTQRGPVRFYLQLMFMFGSDFDTDPQWPRWTHDLLRSGSIADQMGRANRLHRGLQDFLQRVAGPGNALARAAVYNFRRVAGEPLPFPPDQFTDGMLQQMREIYPERVDYVGRDALVALIEEAKVVAGRHGLTTPRGMALTCLLMFELGHGCFRDPLYPWIGRTTIETRHLDPEPRTRRLEGRTRAYMELIIRRFEQA